jgi:ABC-type uncharacterized transport system involved in gliding motility auxiliary subunit
MNRWLRFAGILGLVLFLFGVIGGLVLDSFTQPLMLSHLLLGLALLLVWFFSIGVRSATQAGAVIRGRQVRFGANALLYGAVFVGVLCVVNWYVNKHDKRWDLTEAGVYSLASQTESVLKNLKKPLRLVGVGDSNVVSNLQMQEVFDLYRFQNPNLIKAEVVSPRTKPQLVDTLGIKPGNLVYLEYGEGDSKGVSRINEFSEEAITNSIIKLTRGDARKVYYVQGHGEPGLEDGGQQGLKVLAQGIDDEHLKIEPLLLSRFPKVPEDAAAVIFVAPTKPLLPQEKEMLVSYAQAGGRLLLFTDPRGSSDVKEIAAQFGIEVVDAVVIDQVQRLFAAPALGAQPVVTEYDAHPITRNFSTDSVTIYNIAAPVVVAGKNDESTTYSEFARTGPAAWGEKSLELVFDSEEPTAVLDKNDISGPVSLAVAYEKRLTAPVQDGAAAKQEPAFDSVARVVVFGDSDFIRNSNIVVYNNRDIVLNALNWIVGEEGGVAIRAKTMRASVAPIPKETFMVILTSSFVVPELLLIFGLWVWWRRRTALV